jgi:hypothetical protein
VIEYFKSELGPKFYNEMSDLKQQFNLVEGRIKTLEVKKDTQLESMVLKANNLEKENSESGTKIA